MNAREALLQQLRGLHLPPEPSIWPPALGWWLLALLALAIAWPLLRSCQRLIARARERRNALRTLNNIEARVGRTSDSKLCADTAVLLRQLALTRFAPREVAALTGDRWLEFLHRASGGAVDFMPMRQALLEAPYRRDAKVDVKALVTLCRQWIRKVV